ncbi:MAG TPA: ABC transporter substrate-binding protein [Stellaceae bacterium]|jgi:ABC-type nitrate/sulfonate/bicarbonate transport system substrate-binding protein|nr:ABC transporter substrate-binding protein [Stellaceae bacterium]
MSSATLLLCRYAAAIVTGTAVLSAPVAQAAVEIRAAESVPGQFSFAPLDIGAKQGIFAQYGLDVTIIAFSGDAKLQEGMASHSIDVGLGGGPAMAFAAKGAPVLAVAATAGAPADIAIAVKADGPIKTIADLRGKRVAVSTVGSLTDWLGHQIPLHEGWGAKDVDIVATGAGSAMSAALITGSIDAGITTTSAALAMEEKREGRVLATMDEFEPRFITHVVFASRDMIDRHPDTIEAFLKGFFASVAYMRSHKAESVRIAAEALHQSPAVVEKSYDLLMPQVSNDGAFDPVALKTIKASFIDMDILTAPPNDDEILTSRFVPVKY